MKNRIIEYDIVRFLGVALVFTLHFTSSSIRNLDLALEEHCKEKIETFSFYEDGTVSRSSTNKNDKYQTSFKFREQGEEYILIGNKTFTDINKVTTIIPDSELYVVAKGYGSGSYNIFYTIDYETDPTRLFVCKQK